jgi:hypothetical protein
MRQSHILVAALLAFTAGGSGAALAFDQQTLGGYEAGGAVGFNDDGTGSPQGDMPTNSLGNYVFTPSSNFGSGTFGGSRSKAPSFVTPSDTGWQNLRPGGRLTR